MRLVRDLLSTIGDRVFREFRNFVYECSDYVNNDFSRIIINDDDCKQII